METFAYIPGLVIFAYSLEDMRKKLTNILPLYLACSILLVFVVFPHHHHDNFICFSTQHCNISAHTEERSASVPHTHNAGCVTQLLQTQPTESSRQQMDEGNSLPSFHIWGIIAENIYLSIFKTEVCPFPEAPDEVLPLLFFTSSKTSRAPPVC